MLNTQQKSKLQIVASGDHTKLSVQLILRGVAVVLPNATLSAQQKCFWEVYKSIPQVKPAEHVLSLSGQARDEQLLEVFRFGGIMKIDTGFSSHLAETAKL